MVACEMCKIKGPHLFGCIYFNKHKVKRCLLSIHRVHKYRELQVVVVVGPANKVYTYRSVRRKQVLAFGYVNSLYVVVYLPTST